MKALAAWLLLGLTACAPVPSSTPPVADTPPQVGGDRDAHGCIGSAGYRWCAKTTRCERPWELAAAQGFDNTADAYAAWCAVTQ